MSLDEFFNPELAEAIVNVFARDLIHPRERRQRHPAELGVDLGPT